MESSSAAATTYLQNLVAEMLDVSVQILTPTIITDSNNLYESSSGEEAEGGPCVVAAWCDRMQGKGGALLSWIETVGRYLVEKDGQPWDDMSSAEL